VIVVALCASFAVLTVHNLRIERLPAALYVPACLGTATVLVTLARWAGIGGTDLGLSTAGLGMGMAVGTVVALVVVGAGFLPATRARFADRRMAGVARAQTAYLALVRIPLGTVAVEEVAFRGVLLALLERIGGVGWAVAGSCLLFGLWHVVPVRATLTTNLRPVRPGAIAAAAVATGCFGAGLCWLRLTTGGLAAPAIVHASTTATATVVAHFVLRPARLGR